MAPSGGGPVPGGSIQAARRCGRAVFGVARAGPCQAAGPGPSYRPGQPPGNRLQPWDQICQRDLCQEISPDERPVPHTVVQDRDAYVTSVTPGNKKVDFFVPGRPGPLVVRPARPTCRVREGTCRRETAPCPCRCSRWKTVCLRVVNPTIGSSVSPWCGTEVVSELAVMCPLAARCGAARHGCGVRGVRTIGVGTRPSWMTHPAVCGKA